MGQITALFWQAELLYDVRLFMKLQQAIPAILVLSEGREKMHTYSRVSEYSIDNKKHTEYRTEMDGNIYRIICLKLSGRRKLNRIPSFEVINAGIKHILCLFGKRPKTVDMIIRGELNVRNYFSSREFMGMHRLAVG